MNTGRLFPEIYNTDDGNISKLPFFTDIAHMELCEDFDLEKSRALILVFKCDFKCEICANSEHCSDFQTLSGTVLRPMSEQCSGLRVSEACVFGTQK